MGEVINLDNSNGIPKQEEIEAKIQAMLKDKDVGPQQVNIEPQYTTAREFYNANPVPYYNMIEQLATQLFIHTGCEHTYAFERAKQYIDHNIEHKDAFMKDKGVSPS